MFIQEFRVQPSNASSDGTIKLRSLLDYFQDTAGLAVEDIEGTATELFARGYAWVLTRYEINFLGKLPMLDEKFVISTFHDPSHGYNTLRKFYVNSHDGKKIIDAKTSWFLVDVKTGRPVKAAAHIEGIDKGNVEPISPDFEEIPELDEENITRSVDFPVRFHDLDYNAHVNNANYFAWVHDECPVDFGSHELKKLCASFRSGAKLGEVIKLQFEARESNFYVCRIIRPDLKKPSAEFSLLWQQK
ncbi:MAG: hypothetical protein IJU48_01410 [Synergistaceae bacterium]|nr:hypothetical protein [Synergistaceae bacterium]